MQAGFIILFGGDEMLPSPAIVVKVDQRLAALHYWQCLSTQPGYIIVIPPVVI